MGEVRGRRFFVTSMVVLGLAATFLMLAGSGFTAQAKRHAVKPAVKLQIKTSSQISLAAGKVKVEVKVTKPRQPKLQRVKLALSLRVGKQTVKSAGKASVRSKRGKQKTVTVKLTKAAKQLAQKCGRTSLTVVSRTGVIKTTRKHGKKHRKTSWKRSGKKSRTLKADSSLCAPQGPKVVPVPATIDLGSADRCDFITESSGPRTECLFPYPNDYFTKADASTDTGLRLNISKDSTPTNKAGIHIDPGDLNRSDGWSPGAPIVTQIPGMDSLQAFQKSGIVAITDKSRYLDADQPVVLIDAADGKRQPIWAEMDANASSAAQTDLEIHTNENLVEGHRYIVALRNLKRADGSTIDAPDGFKLYRNQGEVTENATIEARRPHFEDIFKTLSSAGIDRDGLYMAWDFTVASERNINERMLTIRDDAFKQLGDNNLADGIQQGHAPAFTIEDNGVSGTVDGIENYPLSPVPASGRGVENIRTITGTFQVPCYLDVAGVPDPAPTPDAYENGCPAGSKFKLGANGLPVRTPGQMMTARFLCNIPRSSVKVDDGSGDVLVDDPARPSLYGHGLFNSYREAGGTNIRQLGTENNVLVCGTDFSGMAEDDVFPSAIPALSDMSKFTTIPDRLQQGLLNFMYLGRLMKTTAAQGGFAGDPAFQDDNGDPLIDPSQLYYYGNSQGGIAGGALTAVAPDFTRSVLYVPGMRYSELLPRSVDFDDYALVLYPSYPVERTRPLLLSMIQSLWDRGEPAGYAAHMTSDPPANTPAHKVLLEMAYGDHQVANVTTEAEARTIGAPLRNPVIDSNRLQPGMVKPWYDMDTLGALTGPAADGNGMFVWDIGPKRVEGGQLFGTDPAPLTNTSPTTSDDDGDGSDGYGIDPHDTVIDTSAAIRKQIADFLQVDGGITNPCGTAPCYAAGWTGPP